MLPLDGPLAEPQGRRVKDKTGMLATLGFVETVAIDRAAGRVTLAFRAAMRHCNFDGAVQGGIITGWLDAAMASAVFALRGSGTTLSSLEIKTAFYAPARPDVTLHATGWVARIGRRTAFLEGEVCDGAGIVLAKASSTATVRSPEGSAAGSAG